MTLSPTKIAKLIMHAKRIMRSSCDPVHDIGHVTRVVEHTQQLSQDLCINTKERHALELAAWWHDAGRTITKKPSFIWMILLDDMISAFMLLWYTLRCGFFNSPASLAARLIFCKSFGTGTILTKILLRKKSRILLDILKDADHLDLLHIERFKSIKYLSNQSVKNQLAFKFIVWVNLNTKIVYMKTEAARTYIKEIITELITWVTQHEVYTWYIKQFGKEWVEKTLAGLENLLDELLLRDIQYKWSQ